MKMSICLALALLAAMPGRAQIFGPNATGGALLGGLAGGIIGHNNHNQTGRGIAIGAASGLILGSIADRANYDSYQRIQPTPNYYVYRSAPAYYYSDYPETGYGYSHTRPNYAVSGALLGGLAGGVIGYNNHNQTGRGILIGAASGLILGSIAEHAAREREMAAERANVVYEPAEQTPAPAPQEPLTPAAAPAPGTSMTGANSLFGRN